MRDFGYWVRRIGAAWSAVLLSAVLGGCTGWPGATSGTAGGVTQHVPASALLVVTNGPSPAASVSELVAGTARPNEQLRIVASGAPPRPVVAADAPAPVTIALAAPPTAPGKGATTYLTAGYTKKMKAWQAKRAADVSAEAAQTQAADVAWAAKLGITAKVRQVGDPPADEGSLAAESAVAASAQPGLAAGAGDPVAGRRVVVLYCDSLGGGPLPAGELTGDDVIVVMSYLASAAEISAAQAAVLEAGAAQVAVLGPLAAPGQLNALVSAGLSGAAGTGAVSGTVLFGNGSYALSATAAAVLGPLVSRLKQPGATAVINGFASTPGTAEGNYLLSYERATAVAKFLEARRVAAAALIIVGHGASDTVGAGDSAANRRVLVVVEESGAG
jgi:outer membrane protein OmpA-like peptidoglycan-associated protein